MPMTTKPGARFRSVTCETEVVVVKAPAGEVDLRCGGRPMVPIDEAPDAPGSPEGGFAEGSLVGKRYVTEDESLEVLCSKAGAGSLSLGEERLATKGAKPLPSSD